MRRIMVLALLLVLAGCGGGDEEQADRGGTRTIPTAMGDVEVPAQPERVVVLDSGELDLAVSLGVKPVGLATAEGAVEEVQPYLADAVRGVPNVGTNIEPSLEKIAALEPDLIIGTKVRVEALYDKLSGIAPTVLGETPADWKANVALHGDAMGLADEAGALMDRFDDRVGEIRDALGDPADTSVAVVRFVPGEIRLYSPVSFVGSILHEDIGLRMPRTAERETKEINATLSLETLDRAAADVMFTCAYGDPGATDQPAAERLASWKRLPAVRSGDVHRVDDNIWMLGIGPMGAGLVLDDLERTLT